jgi:hypothetical protein
MAKKWLCHLQKDRLLEVIIMPMSILQWHRQIFQGSKALHEVSLLPVHSVRSKELRGMRQEMSS